MHLHLLSVFRILFFSAFICSFGLTQETSALNNQKTKNNGFCLYFTGLPSSGKSTLVQALQAQILKQNPDQVITILDGDEIRENISPELGFSKKDRSLNVRRIGYIASLIVKHGGICLCANIAPYAEDRAINRQKINQAGKYIEAYVDTPLAICEQRDPKGLYKLARKGIIKEFTGISDPYEIPNSSEIHLDGTKNIESNLEEIFAYLHKTIK